MEFVTITILEYGPTIKQPDRDMAVRGNNIQKSF